MHYDAMKLSVADTTSFTMHYDAMKLSVADTTSFNLYHDAKKLFEDFVSEEHSNCLLLV
jgi:hypothetical protein